MRAKRIWLVSLLLAAAIAATAGAAGWWAHDSLLAASLVAAGGLLWTVRTWRSWLVAGALVLSGLAWSALDVNGCSFGSRVRLGYEKAVGHLPYIPWSEIRQAALSSACFASPERNPEIGRGLRLLEQAAVAGHRLERYATPLGEFWIPPPGQGLLEWLLWEITVEDVYEAGEVRIRPGDTVVDCGAHVGVFTRYALRRGAGRVVAVEPDPANIAALEANFGREIAEGRVTLVKGGVWDQRSSLTLSDSPDNSARHSFVVDRDASAHVSGVPVWPLDEIVAQLGLSRVDFIKMDIEGAERRALAGAQQTLSRHRPRLAICTYHLPDDTAAIPAVVGRSKLPYRIHAKNAETHPLRFVTKVMFFHVAS